MPNETSAPPPNRPEQPTSILSRQSTTDERARPREQPKPSAQGNRMPQSLRQESQRCNRSTEKRTCRHRSYREPQPRKHRRRAYVDLPRRSSPSSGHGATRSELLVIPTFHVYYVLGSVGKVGVSRPSEALPKAARADGNSGWPRVRPFAGIAESNRPCYAASTFSASSMLAIIIFLAASASSEAGFSAAASGARRSS